MLGHFPRQQADTPPTVLIPWLKERLLSPEERLYTGIQVRLRGNILHVLCESSRGELSRSLVLMRLVRGLMEPEVQARFAGEFPQIYQIYVYSRRALESKPVWSAPIYLNRLERHLERLVAESGLGETTGAQHAEGAAAKVVSLAPEENAASADPAVQASAAAAAESADLPERLSPGLEGSLERLSDIALARQGDSGAIARYLSEALSTLNVGVQVSTRVVPGKARRSKSVISARGAEASEEDEALDLADPLKTAAAQKLEADVQKLATVQRIPADAPPAPQPTLASAQNLEEPAALVAAEESAIAQDDLVSRLWIFCEASYSPDPLLIAEPIAERLRRLRLRQFQDAVITIQVAGEASSDWRLRVDLTPPDAMLRAWGRWGDVPALSALVNQIAKAYGLKLVTEVKKGTLHLISYPISPVDSQTGVSLDSVDLCRRQIDVDGLVQAVTRLLMEVAPQGLMRAMIYGPSTDDISPEWLRGLDLPAKTRPELASSVRQQIAKGNLPALAYCLTRALNPDIREQLATGGIRVQLLVKDKLLHVMADGPVCPPKHTMVPLVTQTLKQLDVPGLEGVRLYGRRAGQKQPMWSHGHDYTYRPRLVPEAKPEFAASEAYIGELIAPVSEESLSLEESVAEVEADIKLTEVLTRGLQKLLLKSQVFTPWVAEERLGKASFPDFASRSPLGGPRLAMICGVVGMVLAVQVDFLVGQALRQESSTLVAAGTDAALSGRQRGVKRVGPNQFSQELASLNWGNQDTRGWGSEGFADDPSSRFDSADFTTSAIDDDELLYSPQQDFVSSETLLAGSTLPSFRSQQLDEKLALYRRRVAQSGPPDILIIGSSRALRGVDPAALRQGLEQVGHRELSVFNFGVNGATAQVVDLIVRRLIPADQLPRMIIWADGARAFNSGRVDVTFDAIAASEGYAQLAAGDGLGGIEDLALGSLADQLNVQAKATDRQLSEWFGQVSSGYSHRGQLRSALGQGFGAIAPKLVAPEAATQSGDTPDQAPSETSLIDFDGFLALSTRFNPATYYQDHARVSGAYDGDYQEFELEGKQSEALNNLLGYTAQHNVPVVFINTPLTDEYLDSYRSEAEDLFQRHMLRVADLTGSLIFRDFGQLWPQGYDYFSDPSHLNRYGAYQVSSRLAQDPLIPWPEPLSEPAQAELAQ